MKLMLKGLYRHAKRRQLVASRRMLGDPEGAVRWAIIGTGYMASVWADVILASKSSVLHGVFSRSETNARRFGTGFGCEHGFSSLDDMLAELGDKVDFVYVATPLETHESIIDTCLDYGVNVLTEKPATSSSMSWNELCRKARDKDVLLIEGMWMLCLPTFKQAQHWISAGEIGDIKLIRVNMNKFQSLQTTGNLQGSEIIMDYGVYALRFATFFLGGLPDLSDVYCRSDSEGRAVDWIITAGKNTVTAKIDLSANSHAQSSASIVGTHGVIDWGNPFNRSDTVSLRTFADGAKVEKRYRYRNMGFEHQLSEVTETLKCGRKESAVLSPDGTRDTLLFVERILSKIKL